MTSQKALVTEAELSEAGTAGSHSVDGGWPDHWDVTRLSDERFFDVENGTWTGEKEPLVECPVIRNTNFTDDGTLNLSNVAIIPIEHRQLVKKRLVRGDIIIERSGGGPKQPVGRVSLFDLPESAGSYCFSNFTSRVRVVDMNVVNPHFLHLCLHYFHQSGQTEPLQRRTTGIRNLAFADYKNSPIPLPPLPEQRAIARALRAVQDAIQARRREVELERERKAALMQRLFTHGTRGEPTKQTEIGEMPESWQVMLLGEVATISTGTTPATDNPAYYEGTAPFVKTSEIANNRVAKTSAHVSLEAVRAYGLKLYPVGTVFLAMYGQGKTRGQCAILDVPAATTQNTAAIVPSNHVDSEYLWQLLMSWYERLRSAGHQGHISHLNLGYVKQFQVPVPTMAEQREIAEVLTSSGRALACVEAELALLDELFRALLEELMSGRLSPLPLVEATAAEVRA